LCFKSIIREKIMLRHIGIIMDGNGRWAARRGLPRTEGHLEGLKAGRRIVEAANRLGIGCVTLYVFSTENWKRAESEVSFILSLVKKYLIAELENYRKDRIRVRHAGDIMRLPEDIACEITRACEDTKNYDGMQVVLALNYGGRDEIVRAVRKIAGGVAGGGAPCWGGSGEPQVRSEGGSPPPLSSTEELISAHLDNPDIGDPDLIIRTAGEYRTSNFLLWEAAYSEYYISPKLWPDFNEDDLKAAIDSYNNRERRFGGVNA
jgi:undecaprenyl diphosphate synthase